VVAAHITLRVPNLSRERKMLQIAGYPQHWPAIDVLKR
jgi:hypothetical protein